MRNRYQRYYNQPILDNEGDVRVRMSMKRTKQQDYAEDKNYLYQAFS